MVTTSTATGVNATTRMRSTAWKFFRSQSGGASRSMALILSSLVMNSAAACVPYDPMPLTVIAGPPVFANGDEGARHRHQVACLHGAVPRQIDEKTQDRSP